MIHKDVSSFVICLCYIVSCSHCVILKGGMCFINLSWCSCDYANYMSSHVYCSLRANEVVSLFGVSIVILATNIIVALFVSRGVGNVSTIAIWVASMIISSKTNCPMYAWIISNQVNVTLLPLMHT